MRGVGPRERGFEPLRVGERTLVRPHEGGSRLCRAEIVACAPLDPDHAVDRLLRLSKIADGPDLRERRALPIAARGKTAVRRSPAADGEGERERGGPPAEPPQDSLSVTVPFHASVSSQS